MWLERRGFSDKKLVTPKGSVTPRQDASAQVLDAGGELRVGFRSKRPNRKVLGVSRLSGLVCRDRLLIERLCVCTHPGED